MSSAISLSMDSHKGVVQTHLLSSLIMTELVTYSHVIAAHTGPQHKSLASLCQQQVSAEDGICPIPCVMWINNN